MQQFNIYNIYTPMSQQSHKTNPPSIDAQEPNTSYTHPDANLQYTYDGYPQLHAHQYNDEEYQRNCQNEAQYPLQHQYIHNHAQNPYYAQPYVQAANWQHYPSNPPNQGWSMGPYYGHQPGWAPHHRFNPQPNFHFQPFPNFPKTSPPIAESPNVFPTRRLQKNKRGHPSGGKHHGYGRGMGRNKCNEFRKRSNSTSSESNSSKQKRHARHKHGHKKEQKCEDIHSQVCSSSEDDLNEMEQKMNSLSLDNSRLKQHIADCLDPFFQKYRVSKKTAHKACQYLVGKFSQVKQLDPLISILYGLENQSPQLLQSPYYGFCGIIKQIVKKQYDIDQIKKALKKKEDLKKKKEAHDSKFAQKYPNPVELEFLQKEDLLALDQNKTIFLIDGNNIMPKQKHFRSYFQSKDERKKAEGQIRLMWMVYEAKIKAQIFFDNQYSNTTYENIKRYLFNQQQYLNMGAVPVHYAEKQLNPNNTADLKLVARLAEIVENQSYKDHEIVLVSADNELCQLCSAIFPVKKTSGHYIFKYCKALIKQRNFGNKEMKGIVKQIFKY